MADTASPSTSTSNTDSSSGYRYWVREGTAPKSAPKKLEAENSAPAAQVGSAWNHAGTFEERDFSKWAKTFLEKAFQGISITVSGAKFSVSDVPKVNGEASVVVSRGKVKEGYEFDVSLKWKCSADDDSEEAEGKVEVHAEKGDDTEVKITSKKGTPFAAKCVASLKEQSSTFERVISSMADELRRK